MADKRISQLIERVDIENNDVLPIVASGATTTNKVTISTIQEWMQDNLDVGVTSVGITLGSTGTDVNVTGSPITTSGNITINIPTASATNRGLLSAADWSTFNGKQNSITLTTSGTSGAATLVGSTLNIPNYSTGVANAYVPYVGAIGSVSLGYNALSASQININGNSPTGGSYLGFKHATSVNTGTNGYTSMYTFGTNTIGFKSVSGATNKDFSFDMSTITSNVAGGRIYSLPDASGMLALTTMLTDFVTLNTAQTITAQKTFTTSGGSDTLIVDHTSGSGIALDISKAGNGEGLRVAKTSGSGNAVTITGGLLSAEAATLSGALNGTSGTFNNGIVSNGGPIGYGGGELGFGVTNSSASSAIYTLATGSPIVFFDHRAPGNTGSFVFRNGTGGANTLLTLASTGAATFSSSVTATSGVFTTGINLQGAAATSILNTYSVGGTIYGYNGISGAANSIINGSVLGDLVIRSQNKSILFSTNGGNTSALTISSTGAATFSSSVTAGAGTFINTSAGASTTGVVVRNSGSAIVGTESRLFLSTVAGDDRGAYISSIITSSSNDNALVFATNSAGSAPTEKLRITSTGSVGIGTASPASGISTNSKTLHIAHTNVPSIALDNIAQNSKFELASIDVAGGALSIRRNTSAATSGATELIRIASTGAATFSSSVTAPQFDVSSGNGMYNAGTNAVGFQTSGLARLTLSSTGAATFSGSVSARNLVAFRQDGGAGLEVNGGDLGSGSFIAKFNDFNNSTRVVITGNGNVGIGTTSPQTTLSIETSGVQNTVSPIITSQSSGTTYTGMYSIRDGAGDQRGLIFQNYTANVGLTEKMRITSDAYLRMASGSGGIQFNGDTAAANALDDYEEGTWTPTLVTGGTINSTTISTGVYCKVGQIVTLRFFVSGNMTSDGTAIAIGGIPFDYPATDLGRTWVVAGGVGGSLFATSDLDLAFINASNDRIGRKNGNSVAASTATRNIEGFITYMTNV